MVVTEDQQTLGEATARVVVYLDDDTEPLLDYEPPLRFELDTANLRDGQHRLRIEAFGEAGEKGIREVPFTVRNGPSIAVSGLRDDDMLHGRIPVLINAYGGRGETQWEPARAETPAPIPTWAWVLFITIVAFGIFYGLQKWRPPEAFADTPTYSTEVAEAIRTADEAGGGESASTDTGTGAAAGAD